jgi:nitrate reductase delta subunit
VRLQNVAPILALIGGRLKQRGVAHYQLFDALLALAGTRLSSDSVAKQVSGEKRMIPVRRWTPCGKRNR